MRTQAFEDQILKRLVAALLLIALFSPVISHAQSAPLGVHFQGEILDAAGNPLEGSSIVFTLQITNSGGTCVLYEERHTLNMTGSGGVFDLVLGTGAVTSGAGSQSASPTIPFGSVFSNARSFSGLVCGTVYSPVSGASRLLKVSFNDGAQTVTLSTPYTIASVPYALYAESLQGKGATDFIQVNSTSAVVTQANLEQVFASAANVTQLMSLISGTATTSGNTNFSGNVSFTNPPTSSTAPSTGSSLVNKTYSDTYIGGRAIDSATLTALNAGTLLHGDVLQWDGTNWVGAPAAGALSFVNGGNSYGSAATLGTSDNYALSFKTNNLSAMTIGTSGKVGIGTSAPNVNLQLVDAAADTKLSVGPSAVSDSSAILYLISKQGGTQKPATIYTGNTGELSLAPATGTTTTIRTGAGNAIATFSDNGNVGIGTTAPVAPLQISPTFAGSAGLDYGVQITPTINSTGTEGYTALLVNSNETATGSGTRNLIDLQAGGVSQFSVSSSGLIIAANKSFGTESQLEGTNSYLYNPGLTSGGPKPNSGGGTLTLKNDTPLDSTLAMTRMSVVNTAGTYQWGYMGAVATSGAGSYAPSIVFGNSPNSSHYYETMRIQGNGNVGIGTTSPLYSLDLGSKTDALRLPAGTTAQQPTSPAAGIMRYNTNNAAPPGWVEFYNGSAWVTLVGASAAGNLSNVGNITGTAGITIQPGGGSSVPLNLDNPTGGAINLTTSAGGIVLQPNTSGAGTGIVTIPNINASASPTTGALVVGGGVGIGGALNVGSSIKSATSITAGTYLIAPALYGSSNASQNLILDSTLDSTKGNVFIAPSGGNVGIGTSTPGFPLTISGAGGNTGWGYAQMQIQSASSEVGASMNNTGTGGRAYSFYSSNDTSGVGGGKFVIADVAASAARLTIDSSGKVGIGTSSPGSSLEIEADAGNTYSNVLTIGTSGNNSGAGVAINFREGNGAYDLGSIYTMDMGPTARMSFSSYGATDTMTLLDGKVGIGTLSPDSKLSVFASTNGDGITIDGGNSVAINMKYFGGNGGLIGLSQGGTFNNLTSAGDILMQANAGNLELINAVNAPIIFAIGPNYTAVSEKMRVAPSGNVGVGTTSPRALLDVNGTVLMKPATSNSGSSIDFLTGNLQYTASDCGAYVLNNLRDGGSYTFVVKGTNPTTCSFTAWTGVGTGTSLTVHLPPDHAATTSSKHTLYSILVMGTDVYMSWLPGL